MCRLPVRSLTCNFFIKRNINLKIKVDNFGNTYAYKNGSLTKKHIAKCKSLELNRFVNRYLKPKSDLEMSLNCKAAICENVNKQIVTRLVAVL